jgi:hypothetical protein
MMTSVNGALKEHTDNKKKLLGRTVNSLDRRKRKSIKIDISSMSGLNSIYWFRKKTVRSSECECVTLGHAQPLFC